MQLELSLNVEQNDIVTRYKRTRPQPQRKGNTTFSCRRERVDERNRVMIARFYYWTEIRRIRHDDVLNILSQKEFFVEERTISNAILDLSDYLDALYKHKTSARVLKKEYPSWCWDTH